jgi:hypothetical protein
LADAALAAAAFRANVAVKLREPASTG